MILSDCRGPAGRLAGRRSFRQLKLVDRPNPLAEIIAKKMIEVAEQGERDPLRLKDRTLQALRS
jgi:hypothetical protein